MSEREITSSLSETQKQLASCNRSESVVGVSSDEQSLSPPPCAPMSVGRASKKTRTRAPLGSKDARSMRGARNPS